MKNQALFSSKDKSKKLKCRLLQILNGSLRVKGKGTLSGKAILLDSFLPPCQLGSALKGKNLLQKEEIFKSRHSFWKSYILQGPVVQLKKKG